MQYFEAMELAARVIGMDPDAADFDETTLETELWEKHDISLDDFQKIAELLIPFTLPAQTIGDAWWQGYVADGAFICKQPLKLTAA